MLPTSLECRMYLGWMVHCLVQYLVQCLVQCDRGVLKNFLAQLGKNLCNFAQDIIAVSAAKLVNPSFVPTFDLVVIDDRSLDFNRVEFSIEIGIEEEWK